MKCKSLNGSFLNQIPFKTSDFGSPWSIPFHHGDKAHKERSQTTYYPVDFEFCSSGVFFDVRKLNGMFRERI